MFDIDQLIADCETARQESEPRSAIKEVLAQALDRPAEIADAFAGSTAGFVPLHQSAELTVLHVVWAPNMAIYPHDHRMWAAIGIYSGAEDNVLYRRTAAGESTLVESGGRRLTTGDVFLLGDDAIHGVTNPRDEFTGAIHVYGGDLINEPRSQWGPGSLEERPYDVDEALRQFTDANDAWLAAPERSVQPSP